MCTAGQRVSLTITGPGPSFFLSSLPVGFWLICVSLFSTIYIYIYIYFHLCVSDLSGLILLVADRIRFSQMFVGGPDVVRMI